MSDESFDLAALGAIPDPVDRAPARFASGASKSSADGAPSSASTASWKAIAEKMGPARTRPQVKREHAIAIGFGVLWLTTVALIAGLRPHYEGVTLIVQGAVPGALAILALALGFSGGRLGFGAPPRLLIATLTLAPVLAGVVIWAVDVPHFPDDPRSGAACGFVELFSGVVPGIALVYAYRRGMANAAGLRMAVLGLGVGLLAAAMWALHCPDSTASHVLLSHHLPALGIAAAAGALAIKLGRIR